MLSLTNASVDVVPIPASSSLDLLRLYIFSFVLWITSARYRDISKSVLKNDTKYREMKKRLAELMEKAQTEEEFRELSELDVNMSRYISGLAKIYGNSPEIITEGKIPDSHICFLDEIYKANDGVLNSLLKALNERVYTNEGITTEIPVISFFSASNEIPNFNNPEEKSLKDALSFTSPALKTEDE